MKSLPPRLAVLILQALPNMHERDDVDDLLIVIDGIHDALTLDDKFADVF